MSVMSVRRLDPDVHAWLREQAAEHGVSVEEEVRSLLRAARDAAVAAKRREEQARWDAVFAQAITLPPGAPRSADVIRKMRDER